MKPLNKLTALILPLAVLLTACSSGPGQYDEFARCLNQSGTKFYGAFWCPHCQNQKALFGSSEQYLPYVECSNPDGQGQTEACKGNDKITGYPTWIFPDESVIEGEASLEELSEKTGCSLPLEESSE